MPKLDGILETAIHTLDMWRSCFLRKRAAPDAILSHPCALGAHCGNTRKRHVDPRR